ncbi:methylated-DNA--protein-cysteine methyltransferase-like [Ptychodera flava]|uniref:methylated-DNA--protein-cysteine methyltransferase-like n=1 Tax=Ptychodera flava TaxID=63121 RepID=UPI00396A0003
MAQACTLSTARLSSPIGEIIVNACSKGVHKIQLSAAESPRYKEGLSDKVVEIERDDGQSPVLNQCVGWLKVYFSDIDEARKMTLPPLHVTTMKPDSFTANVWKTLTEEIPVGQTISYGELAGMVGNVKASRAVGGAMRLNQVPLIIPCHRVIGSQGKLGNYMSDKGIPIKKWLLRHEGVTGF